MIQAIGWGSLVLFSGSMITSLILIYKAERKLNSKPVYAPAVDPVPRKRQEDRKVITVFEYDE